MFIEEQVIFGSNVWAIFKVFSPKCVGGGGIAWGKRSRTFQGSACEEVDEPKLLVNPLLKREGTGEGGMEGGSDWKFHHHLLTLHSVEFI